MYIYNVHTECTYICTLFYVHYVRTLWALSEAVFTANLLFYEAMREALVATGDKSRVNLAAISTSVDVFTSWTLLARTL